MTQAFEVQPFALPLDPKTTALICSAIALIQKNVGIGYIPHLLAQPLLNNGQLVKKPMQEHKHSTKLFLAARSDGMGTVCQWCMDYLLHPEVKMRLSGG
jgi:DNA-binding transcriptional LysR family regulator